LSVGLEQAEGLAGIGINEVLFQVSKSNDDKLVVA
jgi:hypothetical protein